MQTQINRICVLKIIKHKRIDEINTAIIFLLLFILNNNWSKHGQQN